MYRNNIGNYNSNSGCVAYCVSNRKDIQMKRLNINPIHYLLTAVTIMIIILFSIKSCHGQDVQDSVQVAEKHVLKSVQHSAPFTKLEHIDTIKVVMLYVCNEQGEVCSATGWMVTKQHTWADAERTFYNRRWKNKHILKVLSWVEFNWK